MLVINVALLSSSSSSSSISLKLRAGALCGTCGEDVDAQHRVGFEAGRDGYSFSPWVELKMGRRGGCNTFF